MANHKSTKAGEEAGPAARVGSVIRGKWKIDALLGIGGMAAVYAASHRNGQRAALKILHVDFAREKPICDRFLREAYVSNKVNHSATTQVLDDDMTDKGEPFLIMELLEGETVRDAWKKSGRTMPAGRVLQICERVVDCLASCHAIKVIHRDLKPANIFITKEDQIKVLDFGVAQMRDATSEKTATGTALGTPAYMSPEQAMGLVDQLDGRADLFSVGAMMHALITGHRINNGRTEQEALVMAATKPVPSVARIAPQLPIELIKAIDKSLAWDRRNRFQDAREMQRALLDLLESQGVSPLPGRPPPRPHEVVAPPLPEVAARASAEPAAAAQPAAPAPAPAPPPAAPPPAAPPPAAPPPPVAAHVSAVNPALAQTAPAQASPVQATLAQPPLVAPPPPEGATQAMPTAPVPARLQSTPSLNVAAAVSPLAMTGKNPALGLTGPQPAFDPLLGFAPPAPAPAPAPVAPPPVPEVPESDPRVQSLRDLMKHLDRLFPSVRQLGWSHPATERTFRHAYDAFADALKQQAGLVSWTLRPYSFMTLGHTVWEPGAPFDAVPYNLFACGVRLLRVEPGITLDEMRDLFGLFLTDPGRDLPPEDDLAAALWEKALPHVQCQCVDVFAEGDAAEREAFFGEADELERVAQNAARNHLSRLEVMAMALSTDDVALAKRKERSPFALDDAMRQHVLPLLDVSREAWSERYVDALVEGYLDAAANRDAPLVLASLRKSGGDLVVAGRFPVAIQINQAVIDRLRQRVQGAENQGKLAAALTNAMFGGETLELVMKNLKEDANSVELFLPALATLGGNEFAPMLTHLRDMTNPQLRTAIATYVERYAAGREAELLAAAPGADPDTASYIVQLLSRIPSPAARQSLAQLAQSEDPNVRVEARVLIAPSLEHAQTELGSLLDNSSPQLRMAALRTITRYGVRSTWPAVARTISAKSFHDLGNEERRELLRACVALSPERGEPVLLDVARKGGVLMSEGREATRAIAAELLGDLSRSRHVATALQELAVSRWGVSEETRMAASNASKRIVARLTSGQSGGASG